MKISGFNLYLYGSRPSGTINFEGGDASVNVKLTEDEITQILALGYEFFRNRQAAIAESIATLQPPVLMPPQVVDAEVIADDMPF